MATVVPHMAAVCWKSRVKADDFVENRPISIWDHFVFINFDSAHIMPTFHNRTPLSNRLE